MKLNLLLAQYNQKNNNGILPPLGRREGVRIILHSKADSEGLSYFCYGEHKIKLMRTRLHRAELWGLIRE